LEHTVHHPRERIVPLDTKR
jgi:hypothetical protein